MSMRKDLLFIPGPVVVTDRVLTAAARPLIDHRGPELRTFLARLEQRMRPVFGTAGEVVFRLLRDRRTGSGG